MLDSDPKNSRTSAYPNIILKKKLAPLPLLNQNISPKHFGRSPNKDITPNLSAIRDSFRSPNQLRSSKSLLANNFRSINNYGRLCDQPFLEFSSFHSEQVFGSGGGRKKIVLEPLQQQKKKRGKAQQIEVVPYQQESKPVEKEQLISIQNSVEIPQVMVNKEKKPKKEKDTEVIVKKVYKIGDYEAIMAFYSLQVVLISEEEETERSVYVGKGDFMKVYKLAHNVIEKAALDALLVQDGDLKVKIKKSKHVKQEYYTGDEMYPEKSEEVDVVIDKKNYKATLYFPYLEILIPALNYQEKIMLKADYLSNLFEEKFNNLQDYISKFNVPPQVYKGKDDIHIDALKNLPTIIKKVVKEKEFGGLMLFKSMEIHLKNTSNIEPKTLPEEPDLTPRSKRLLRRKNSDINSILLRLKLDEVNQLVKCTGEEIEDLVKESVFVEVGTGFEIKFDEEKVNIYEQRQKIEHDSFPERSESFTVRFNRFLYEVFVKFPTLELYIPETTYRDIIHLKPSQLQDLLDNEMKNMGDYLHLFKKPQFSAEKIEETETVSEQEKSKEESTDNKESEKKEDNNDNDYPEEEQKVLSYQQKTLSTVAQSAVDKSEEVEALNEKEKPVEDQ